ncbi:GNAT family N-acetyltransferase [Elizabethkingia meningoseptica]|uniref:GNAT family N-acetyltransferase n=1 Tax=Elizabethkingia meningoseptica TaxID=238 RepID=UPI00201323BC|nr:GNAT family N-acetyltransferase [Elizabethkingia meningoseptica]MCL1674201.1 GNAT family N-acetyltransferase [Elizabethkingia meningoseptica]MCL1685158.1 GNAT family N-acetyltransferase [Elizabethkingia meningoseptica]
MSEISLKKVIDDKMLMDFIQFPMTLYKNNPNFVPPLINDEKQIWDPKENPALAYSEAELYLAYKNNQIVGRIALMINHKEGQELEIHKVRFGWIDFIDDLSVSKALLDKAAEYAKQHNINKIEGPMGFTNLDKAGMLTMGFDKIATMIGIYNFEYYPKHLEQLGLVKEKEWVEFEIVFPEVLSEKVIKFNEIIKEKYQLKVLKFNNKKEILPLVEPMFKLLDETYKGLSTYTPITQQQIQTYKEKYFGFIDKDFIVCITDADDKLISFAITMPSYSKALQKANGKLFPFGWWHFLQAGKKNDRANFYLIGIHPEYQRRGVTAIIFKEIYDIFKKKGVKFLETNPELEENKNIQLLWQDYDPVNHKRRRTYSKEL